MKKPTAFPFEHQAGGLVFRVYSAPLTKLQNDNTQKEYESYLVKYYEGSRQISNRRSSWKKVEALIEEVAIAHRKQDLERLELTGLDRRVYLAAVEALKPVDKTVDLAAIDYSAATKILEPFKLDVRQAVQLLANELKRVEGVPLPTIVDFYLLHGKTMSAIKTVPQVIDELTDNLQKDGRGEYHIRDLNIRLRRFAESFPGNINEIREQELTHWLQGLKKIVNRNGAQVENEQGKPVSQRTRNNYRNAICELFTYARKRGYLPKGLPTPAAETVRMKVVPGKNHILTPDEAERLLKNLSPHLIPYTVLKLFSGLRTEEAFGLKWEDLRFKSDSVIIEAKLAKLRQRRVPPILPNLMKWLAPFQGLKGLINPQYSKPNALLHAVGREATKAKVILKRNTFRNCYISYRVAEPNPSALVAEETGTSTGMIKANYLELATRADAKKWFSIHPSKAQISQLKSFAVKLKRLQAM